MIRLRDARPEDAGALARVHVESWRQAYDGLVPRVMLDAVVLERRIPLWETLLGPLGAGFVTLVAEDDKVGPIGFATATPANNPAPGIDGELQMLFILPGFQRRDVGRRLFLALVQRLVADGCRSMVATVLENPAAIGFFNALEGGDVSAESLTVAGHKITQHLFTWRDLAQIPFTPEQ
jgi:GNAT superfamily N-acetyltransferase